MERKIETVQGKKFLWTDLQSPDRSDVEKLAEKYNFNSLNIDITVDFPYLSGMTYSLIHIPINVQRLSQTRE